MPKRYGRGSPETKIRNALRLMLEGRGWLVEIMHGSLYQSGVPDLYIAHTQHGQRWIDVKVEGRYNFTKAQKYKWPRWHYLFKVGIWILTGSDQEQYDRLFCAPNMLDYWRSSWGDPKDYLNGPDIDSILDQIEE